MAYKQQKWLTVAWYPGERVRPMHGESGAGKRGVISEVMLRRNDNPLYYVKWDDEELTYIARSVNPDELRSAPSHESKGKLNITSPVSESDLDDLALPRSVRASLKRLKWGEDLHKRNLAKKEHLRRWRKVLTNEG